jgi:hypothetical protein
VIDFIIRPTAKGWEICRDGINIGTFLTRRQALKTLAAMRAELRANGQRSLIKFEPRLRHHAENRLIDSAKTSSGFDLRNVRHNN